MTEARTILELAGRNIATPPLGKATLVLVDYQNEYRLLCPRSTYYEWNFPEPFRCRGCFTDPTGARFSALHAGLATCWPKPFGVPRC